MTNGYKERRKAKHAAQKAKPLNLPLGEPYRCCHNSMCAVWRHSDRLRYVEGFVTNGCDYRFIHHSWVVDIRTGMRRELTFRDQDPNAVYIGKEFTKADLKDRNGEPLDSPENYCEQLTLQDQYDLLTTAGYSIVLMACFEDDKCNEVTWDSVDMDSIDLTDPYINFKLNAEKGFDLRSGDGWEWTYRWMDKRIADLPEYQALEAAKTGAGAGA